jgi:hypothetical protein
MKMITRMVLLSVMTASMIGCKKDIMGVGPHITETRPISYFTGIDLRMNGNVYYKKGNTLSLEIIAQQNILDMLETNVINNILVIRYRDGKTSDADESIRISVTAPYVNNFSLNTSGSIYSLDDIQATNLWLHSSGSGAISLKNVVAETIEAVTTAAGSINALNGTVVSENLKTYGSGQIILSGILARTAKIRTSGSGKVQVRVADYLHATIEGSGSIYYSGYPDVSSHISGSGHIVHF